jgi:hypothetical protein
VELGRLVRGVLPVDHWGRNRIRVDLSAKSPSLLCHFGLSRTPNETKMRNCCASIFSIYAFSHLAPYFWRGESP